MNQTLRNTLLHYLLPVSIALTPSFVYSQNPNQPQLEEANINNDVLDFLKPKLSSDVYDNIASNYDSLVSRVDNFEDVNNENNKRFEQQINWFLGIQNGISYHFYITDSEDINSRKLNMLLKVSYVPEDNGQVKIKYQTMYIPNPKN